MYKRRITPNKRKRPWFWLIGLVVSAALFVVGQLLMPDPDIEDAKAGGLDDFGFPTALENRVIPVLWGTNRIKAPNTIWYGDLRVVPIREKIKVSLFKSKWITQGHKYYVGFDQGICYGPIDAITDIRIDDKKVWTEGVEGPATGLTDGSSADGVRSSINKPELLGGYKKGGGVVGSFRLYNGNPSVNPDPYIFSKLSVANQGFLPGYNGLARVVWEGGNIGERTSIGKWEMVVHRYPNTLGLTGNKHRVNTSLPTGHGDANPICCLYEILTNADFGLNINVGEIDTAAFQAAGETVFDEGNGFSYLINKATKAEDITQEILRQVDGVIYQNPEGKMSLKLIRSGYDESALTSLDESSIQSIKKFSKQGWTETQNAVHVEYVDRLDDFKQTIAPAYDMGNLAMLNGQQNLSKLKFPGVKDRDLAAKIAQRELATGATPLVQLELDTDRSVAGLNPGDVIKVSYDEYGLDDLNMRISDISKGTLENGTVGIKCVEDIFASPEYINFIGGAQSLHQGVSMQPVKASVEITDGVPAWMRRFVKQDDATIGLRGLHIVEAPNGVTREFLAIRQESAGYTPAGSDDMQCVPTCDSKANVGVDGSGDPLPNLLTRTSDVYIAHGGVDAGGEETSVITLDSFDVATAFTAQSEAEIKEFGYGLIMMGNEIMAYEAVDTATITSGVTPAEETRLGFAIGGPTLSTTEGVTGLKKIHRGLFDTDIEDHPFGTKVWFLSTTDFQIDEDDLTPGVNYNYKHIMNSPGGSINEADADVSILTAEEALRPEKPLRPANVTIQGNAGEAGHGVDTGTSDVTVGWTNHTTDQTSGEILFQDDASVSGTNYPVTVEWQLEDSPGAGTYTTIITNITSASATSDTVTHTAIMTAAGWTDGDEADHNMRVKLTRKNTGHAEAGAQIARAIPYRDLVHRGDS